VNRCLDFPGYDLTRASIATSHDVEESYKAAEALRASEEKYRNIFENIAEGVFQTTPDGLLIGANPALARMFGYESPDEMISHVNDLARQLYAKPEDREDFKRRFDDRVAVEGYEVEPVARRTHWVSIHAARCDESGKILTMKARSRLVRECRTSIGRASSPEGSPAGGAHRSLGNGLSYEHL